MSVQLPCAHVPLVVADSTIINMYNKMTVSVTPAYEQPVISLYQYFTTCVQTINSVVASSLASYCRTVTYSRKKKEKKNFSKYTS